MVTGLCPVRGAKPRRHTAIDHQGREGTRRRILGTNVRRAQDNTPLPQSERMAISGNVAIVFFEAAGKTMVAMIVTDKEKIVGGGRMQGRLQ